MYDVEQQQPAAAAGCSALFDPGESINNRSNRSIGIKKRIGWKRCFINTTPVEMKLLAACAEGNRPAGRPAAGQAGPSAAASLRRPLRPSLPRGPPPPPPPPSRLYWIEEQSIFRALYGKNVMKCCNMNGGSTTSGQKTIGGVARSVIYR